jgi:NAD-dependent dihydropyrimidine dehydrogenase PreA subunit
MPLKQVPRENIPWYPTIDEEKCDGCRICFQFCQHGVYQWDEENNIAKVIQPFQCVVGCNGCQPLCPPGAIFFPDIDAIQEIIRKLREG